MTENDLPKKMPLSSLDIAAEKRDELRRVLAATFPEIMAEEKIDPDQLRRVLGEWVEPDRERFGLTWPGKAACMKVIQAPSVGTLKPCPEESVDWDTTQNVFIEGDNLEVLKLLQKAYFGKIKMIYIDPPYNTGTDFIYPDHYAETLDTYLAYTGQIDDEGKRFSTNSDQSGRLHSRWLRMIYPRLYLAKNLLRQDGLIFISIDNNEASHLRDVCDEIFGSENFIEQIAWKNKYGAGAKTKGFIEVHEYILCYSKAPIANIESVLTDEQKEEYKNRDERFTSRGGYVTQPLMTASLGDRENLQYTVEHNGELIRPRKQWVWEKTRLLRAIANNEVIIKKKDDGEFSVRAKVYLRDENGKLRKGKPLSLLNGPFNQSGTQETDELLGPGVFGFPKPSELIKFLFSFCINEREESDGIYLDFFSGSCAAAQAVMELNKEDGGNRRFIMVQLPEPCDAKTEAFKKGYKNIADIGRERIRKYGAKLRRESATELKLTSNRVPDVGYRSFHLGKSNFRIWDDKARDVEQLETQLTLHVEHISAESSAEDILFELLLKDGFGLTIPMRRIQLAGIDVFSIAGGAMLICLDRALTQELMDAMADMEPSRVICLDAGFQGNDQLKANAVQTFKARARNRETAIEFRTV